jgi:hypothetical protein
MSNLAVVTINNKPVPSVLIDLRQQCMLANAAYNAEVGREIRAMCDSLGQLIDQIDGAEVPAALADKSFAPVLGGLADLAEIFEKHAQEMLDQAVSATG